MVPIDGEAEKALIEFIRFLDVKDAENRYHPVKPNFHDHTPLDGSSIRAELRILSYDSDDHSVQFAAASLELAHRAAELGYYGG
jgi:hypothetical protein